MRKEILSIKANLYELYRTAQRLEEMLRRILDASLSLTDEGDELRETCDNVRLEINGDPVLGWISTRLEDEPEAKTLYRLRDRLEELATNALSNLSDLRDAREIPIDPRLLENDSSIIDNSLLVVDAVTNALSDGKITLAEAIKISSRVFGVIRAIVKEL